MISADGTKTPIDLTSSIEKLQAAISAAESQGLKFADEPVRLSAGPALERLATRGGV